VFNSDQGTQFTSHGDSVQEIRIEDKSAMQYPKTGAAPFSRVKSGAT
jgi:hypothetical protein